MSFYLPILQKKKRLLTGATIFYFTLFVFSGCRLVVKEQSPWIRPQAGSEAVIKPRPFEALTPGFPQLPVRSEWRNPKQVTALVLHTTGDLSASDYIRRSAETGYMVHYVITRDGTLYGEFLPGSVRYRAAPGMDDQSIHIAAEGNQEEILSSPDQKKTLYGTVKILSVSYNIPLTNYDIISKKGVFTHTQSKVRYGSFINLNECGGENLIRNVMENTGGSFYPQSGWKDRFEEGWILVRENPDSLKTRREIDTGRGFTEAPVVKLKGVVTDENGKTPEKFRQAYPFRGTISPSCIVLHYTALDTYQKTLDILEERRLGSQIIVDKDGKGYLAMDYPEHRAAAAYGLNEYCIHFEIVAKDAADILNNETQAAGVARLVKSVAAQYRIPLNNRSPESKRGIFSHTQAKKKWGRSVFLHGEDFDPGEAYMKKIIEMAGGTYYPEPEWKDRMSDDWAILYGDFQP